MHALLTILVSILALGIIIIVHEFGHYWVATRCGVFVEVFSIGFGRAIYQRTTKSGMLFKIGWLPIGGYIVPHGQNPATKDINPKTSYNKKPVWQQMLIVLAGPGINFLLAIFIYWGLYTIGIHGIKPIIQNIIPNTPAAYAGLQAGDTIKAIDNHKITNWRKIVLPILIYYGEKKPLAIVVQRSNDAPLTTLYLNLSGLPANISNNLWQLIGITPPRPTVLLTINRIIPNSLAAKAGLKAGDKITAINHRMVKTWKQLHQSLLNNDRSKLTVTYLRQQRLTSVSIPLPTTYRKGFTLGIINQSIWPPHLTTVIQYPFWLALPEGIQETFSILELNTIFLYKLAIGKLSPASLGGPLSIVLAGKQAAQQGITPYLLYIAYISVAIGFINLLPIPGLDGGHFLFQLIKVIRGKPISDKWQQLWTLAGFGALLIIMVLLTRQDLLRLIWH